MGTGGGSGRDTVLREYHTIWTEAWKFFRVYFEQIPMDESAWERCIRMTAEFVNQHPDHEDFARVTIMTIERELEVRDKEARKENGTWNK